MSPTAGQTYTYTLTLTNGTKPQNEYFGLHSTTLGLNRFKTGVSTCAGTNYFCYSTTRVELHREYTVSGVNFSGHVLASTSPHTMTLRVAVGTPVGTQVKLGVVNSSGVPRGNAMTLTVAADTTAPTVSDATVDGASLVVTFDESLAAAANLRGNRPCSEKGALCTGSGGLLGGSPALTLSTDTNPPDLGSLPSLSIADTSGTEDSANLAFDVSLSKAGWGRHRLPARR